MTSIPKALAKLYELEKTLRRWEVEIYNTKNILQDEMPSHQVIISRAYPLDENTTRRVDITAGDIRNMLKELEAIRQPLGTKMSVFHLQAAGETYDMTVQIVPRDSTHVPNLEIVRVLAKELSKHLDFLLAE